MNSSNLLSHLNPSAPSRLVLERIVAAVCACHDFEITKNDKSDPKTEAALSDELMKSLSAYRKLAENTSDDDADRAIGRLVRLNVQTTNSILNRDAPATRQVYELMPRAAQRNMIPTRKTLIATRY